VRNFSNTTTHSFEVWIRKANGTTVNGPGSEQITIDYAPNTTFPGDGGGLGNASLGDPGSGVNWGAENRDGTSGVNLSTAPADGSEYQTQTTNPTAGGQVAIPYDIWSKKAGSYTSVASMTSNQTPGTTQVVTPITVTP
jgi:hypothetical protein